MVEEHDQVEVKVISREIVKPSSPTPSHLKTFTLSLLDQTFPSTHHVSWLFVYTINPFEAETMSSSALKASLSRTLTTFYPLAGRLNSDSTVDCNDEGVPFIITHVSAPSKFELLNSPNQLELLSKFFPPRELKAQHSRQPVSDRPLLAFQVNFLDCGGVVLGCYALHKLLDGISFATFIKHWAALAAGKPDVDVIQPDYGITVKTFPPSTGLPPTSLPLMRPSNFDSLPHGELAIRTFAFSKASLSSLKASNGHPNPTSFEALASFIWKHASLAAGDSVGPTIGLTIPASIRARIKPPLPIESMGNIVIPVQAQADKWANFGELVAEIRESLSNKLKGKVDKLKETNAPAAFVMACRDEGARDRLAGKAGFYALSSLCKVGLDQVDFGFGKPKWFKNNPEPTPMGRNFILFTEYIDGILVTLCLKEDEMKFLESNLDFISFTKTSVGNEGTQYCRL